MTRTERERLAVINNTCPRCHMPQLSRCRSMGAVRKVMKHPHAERIALMEDALAERAALAGEKPEVTSA